MMQLKRVEFMKSTAIGGDTVMYLDTAKQADPSNPVPEPAFKLVFDGAMVRVFHVKRKIEYMIPMSNVAAMVAREATPAAIGVATVGQPTVIGVVPAGVTVKKNDAR